MSSSKDKPDRKLIQFWIPTWLATLIDARVYNDAELITLHKIRRKSRSQYVRDLILKEFGLPSNTPDDIARSPKLLEQIQTLKRKSYKEIRASQGASAVRRLRNSVGDLE